MPQGHSCLLRRFAGPGVKGAEERIGIFKAEEEGDLRAGDGGGFQIVAGELFARFIEDALEMAALFLKLSLERSGGGSELLRDRVDGGAAGGEQFEKGAVDTFGNGARPFDFREPAAEFRFEELPHSLVGG